jgi:hypothetical protein
MMNRVVSLLTLTFLPPSSPVYAFLTREQIQEELRHGVTIWEYLLLLIAFYVFGLLIVWIGLAVKFRKHATMLGYFAKCWAISRDQAWSFAGFSLVVLLVGIPFILIPTGILIAAINGIFFDFRSENLIIGWLVFVMAADVAIALIWSYREVLKNIDESRYFQSQRDHLKYN